jgi:tRNA-2-methylthio-N6-dimethylallyladenosine synthase
MSLAAEEPSEVLGQHPDVGTRRAVDLGMQHRVRHRARVGQIEDVLVEGPSRRDAAMWTGRTRQGKLVHFPVAAPAPAPAPGAYADVAVTGAAPHHLVGELRQVTSAPRHRARLPLTVG